MKRILLILMILIAPKAFGQAWSGILDPSRAIDWSNAGFSVPNYTTACSGSPPTLIAGSGNVGANTAAITAAIATCDGSTHNVVNLPSGTYYVSQINYQAINNVVVRGTGADSTYLYIIPTPPATTLPGCLGYNSSVTCQGGNALYAQSTNALPGNANVCNWTSGYSQGSTSLTFNSCGSGTSLNVGDLIVLDQADDALDTGGVFLCSTFNQTFSPSFGCSQKGAISGVNAVGRVLPTSIQYSEQQLTRVTSVSGSGTGPYTVGIEQGVYFNNIRSGQNPGAWWPFGSKRYAAHEGLEDVTLDMSNNGSNIGVLQVWCYQCWEQGVRSLNGLENHTDMISSYQPVIQNNYFYGSQHGGAESYAVQMEEVSGGLVQNNIMQNVTSPDIKDAVTGSVSAYNFTPYINFGVYMQGMYGSHNSGTAMNLEEGNATTSFLYDDIWGTSDLVTSFRNHQVGWQPTYSKQTYPYAINTYVRGVNIIGNILGEPGYHTLYSAQATSATGGQYQTNQSSSPTNCTNGGSSPVYPGCSSIINTVIYEVGWTDTSGLGVCSQAPQGCDPLSFSTLMRWGNYDTVDNAVIWDNTESSPGAVAFINAQSTPGSHTLPSSFYLASRPSWFRSVPFPPYGPDVTGGTTGICSGGTYAGVWATSSGQCPGGTLTASAWAGHANANPAQDCYLNVMNGPPDGSGGALTFNAAGCYSGSAPTLVSIAIAPTSATIAGGATQAFTATGTYSDSSTANITTTVTWSSASTGVATIGASTGIATGVSAGTSNITCTLSAITSNTAVLTVKTLSSIAIVPTTPSVSIGNTQAFTATGTYSDSSTANLTTSVTWHSASTGVATIASSGVATAVGAGTSNITATLGVITSNTAVMTVPAPPTNVFANPLLLIL